eukprot:2541253-Pleurochrysis_carterae.AAC.1
MIVLNENDVADDGSLVQWLHRVVPDGSWTLQERCECSEFWDRVSKEDLKLGLFSRGKGVEDQGQVHQNRLRTSVARRSV